MTGARISITSVASRVIGCLVFLLTSPHVFAQNTGGVFGPEVTPGSRAFEARFAAAPASDGRPSRFASRVHYQQSVSENLRLRVVVQGADTPGDNFDIDFVQFEAQFQFREDEIHGWDSAVRFDVQLADDRADFFGVNWTSDFYLSDRLSFRGVLLGAVQLGSERTNGLFLQTRTSLRYKLTPDHQLQLQMFNNYGSSADFQDFGNQDHSIGPAVSGKLTQGWSYEASALFGVTSAAPDTVLRVFVTRTL